MTNDLKIGLAFSGGGFRAASFNLGVLTYLNGVKTKSGESLLKKVVALSTVSGGTITGTRYALGIARNESFEEIYKAVYEFLSSKDLVSLSIDRLVAKEGWGKNRIKSLVNAFADVYDEHLFDHEKFGILMTGNQVHLKHLSFNATEFSSALQFRFQWSDKILKHDKDKDEPERGIIGNYYYRIPENIASEIRMADILAASSCFPGGFEPINFPNDFILPEHIDYSAIVCQEDLNIGLMDGGIVDNQGIEPLLLADQRMARNLSFDDPETSVKEHPLDLIIVSDVASPYMKDFKASVQKDYNWWRKLTPLRIFIINTLVLAGSIIGLCLSVYYEKPGLTIFLSFLATLNLLMFILAMIFDIVPGKFKILKPFLKPLSKLLRLKLLVYENLLVNRGKSMSKMIGEIFLKHVRRLNYEKIFEDQTWKNRRIMNAIYELRPGEKKLREKVEKGSLPVNLIPSEYISKVAFKAAGMSTTLWFTKEELIPGGNEKSMLDHLIACGQFTICWNLLEYIAKIKNNPANTNQNHRQIIDCEDQLLSDWKKFQDDPFWQMNT